MVAQSKLTILLRTKILDCLLIGLRLYMRFSPFKRGRGVFIRPVEALKSFGWPAPTVRLNNGLAMELQTSLVGWTCFERGEWEPMQTKVLTQHLKKDSVVVNVGANTGYYTLLAASAIGAGGKVFAFEIQPRMVAILKRNLELNNFHEIVTVVDAGCFSSEGSARIFCSGDPGTARVDFGNLGVQVRLIRLDDYIAEHVFARLDLILIDVEGADFDVIKGAADALAKFRPVVIAEVDHLRAFGGSEEDMISFMSELNYSARVVDSEYSRDILFEPMG